MVVVVALAAAVGYRAQAVRKDRSVRKEAVVEAVLIRTAHVARGDLSERLELTGTIRPKNEVDVFAKVPGRIDQVFVQVGQTVKENQVLATIEHKEIAWQAKAAEAAFEVAKANLDGARQELERTQALFEGGSAPKAQLDGMKTRLALAQAQAAQAEAAAGLAQQQVANSKIEAPIGGVVTRRNINLGAMVGPQSPAFTVQNVSSLKLETSADASSFVRLKKEQRATVSTEALPGEVFDGKVAVLSPSLDAQTRRAAVEIEVENSKGRLLPNMFSKASVTVGELRDQITVPREAILEAAGGACVFRVKDGKVEKVRPSLGTQDGRLVQVLSGLEQGDEVAISSLPNLSDGTAVLVAPKGENALSERR